MKKFKISDGNIRKIEKRLLKVIKQQYPSDGMWVEVAKVHIEPFEDEYLIDLTINYGRTTDTGVCNYNQFEINLVDGNLDFIAGQFAQALISKNN